MTKLLTTDEARQLEIKGYKVVFKRMGRYGKDYYYVSKEKLR